MMPPTAFYVEFHASTTRVVDLHTQLVSLLKDIQTNLREPLRLFGDRDWKEISTLPFIARIILTLANLLFVSAPNIGNMAGITASPNDWWKENTSLTICQVANWIALPGGSIQLIALGSYIAGSNLARRLNP